MNYSERVLAELAERDKDQPEFVQAATEVLENIQPVLDAHPEYEEAGLLERLVEPERVITFRVPWMDDNNKVHVNRGYRIEFNSAIGPYKGGLRFNKAVSCDVLIKAGTIPSYKRKRTTFVHVADLDAYTRGLPSGAAPVAVALRQACQ